MTDTTTPAAADRTPVHLWIVGGLSLLWNGFGGFDFIMTTTQGATYMQASGFDQPLIDYYLAMPAWMYGPWTLGVWGGVAGSILLLMRSRFAVWAFGLSLVGVVVGLIYGQFINPPPPLPADLAMMSYMPWVITVIAAILAWYAWTMNKRGVLR